MSEDIKNIEKYLKETNSRYSIKSLEFTVFMIEQIIAEKGSKISTPDIIELFPRVVMNNTGYLWNCALKEFNIATWEDVGNVIFLCIHVGIFTKSPEDRLEDFIIAEEDRSLVDTFEDLEKSGFITKELSLK